MICIWDKFHSAEDGEAWMFKINDLAIVVMRLTLSESEPISIYQWGVHNWLTHAVIRSDERCLSIEHGKSLAETYVKEVIAGVK